MLYQKELFSSTRAYVQRSVRLLKKSQEESSSTSGALRRWTMFHLKRQYSSELKGNNVIEKVIADSI